MKLHYSDGAKATICSYELDWQFYKGTKDDYDRMITSLAVDSLFEYTPIFFRDISNEAVIIEPTPLKHEDFTGIPTVKDFDRMFGWE